MNTDNQTYVILFMGLALILAIILNQNEAIITGLIGALGGMFMGKTMNEKQSELVDNQLKDEILNTISNEITSSGCGTSEKY